MYVWNVCDSAALRNNNMFPVPKCMFCDCFFSNICARVSHFINVYGAGYNI